VNSNKDKSGTSKAKADENEETTKEQKEGLEPVTKRNDDTSSPDNSPGMDESEEQSGLGLGSALGTDGSGSGEIDGPPDGGSGAEPSEKPSSSSKETPFFKIASSEGHSDGGKGPSDGKKVSSEGEEGTPDRKEGTLDGSGDETMDYEYVENEGNAEGNSDGKKHNELGSDSTKDPSIGKVNTESSGEASGDIGVPETMTDYGNDETNDMASGSGDGDHINGTYRNALQDLTIGKEKRNEMCRAEEGDSGLIQMPFVLAMDVTASQQRSRQVVMNLMRELNITRALSYTLVTFDDCRYCKSYNKAVKVYPPTTELSQFLKDLKSVEFEKGGDKKERLFGGMLTACEQSPRESLILVTTDNGSKDDRLLGKIKKCLAEKGSTAYIVLNPYYEGDELSRKQYEEVANSVINISRVGIRSLKTKIVDKIEKDCKETLIKELMEKVGTKIGSHFPNDKIESTKL